MLNIEHIKVSLFTQFSPYLTIASNIKIALLFSFIIKYSFIVSIILFIIFVKHTKFEKDFIINKELKASFSEFLFFDKNLLSVFKNKE